MGAIIFAYLLVIIFLLNLLVISFLLIRNILFLFRRSPEKHFKKAISEFDKNIKAIDNLGKSPDYKLGSGHIYQN